MTNNEEKLINHQLGFVYGITPKGMINVCRSHADKKFGTLITLETLLEIVTIRIKPDGKMDIFGIDEKKENGFINLPHGVKLDEI